MYLIVTRAFPPELGGMQSLMSGLSKEMAKKSLQTNYQAPTAILDLQSSPSSRQNKGK